MASTIQFLGTRITDVESATNWTTYKFAGGGGGASATDFPADGFVQGTSALAFTYTSANRAFVACYDYVLAGGSARNFNSGGNAENQLVYVWANGLFPLSPTGTAVGGFYGGLGIALSDNATLSNSWAAWSIYGVENYPGGWQKLVIDPRKAPTASGGTFSPTSLSSIRQFGIAYVFTAGKTGPQGVWVDAIDVGSGLRVFGTSTSDDGFGDVLNADEGTANNRYGIIKSLEATDTVLQLQGKLFIGDNSGVNLTNFDDINKIVTFNNPQYINSAAAFVNAIPDDYLEISYVGNSTSGTTINFGEKVGAGDTARGRNGILFLGNSDYDTSINFNVNNNVNTVGMYGCTLRNLTPTGNLNWSATSGHEFIGSFVDSCSQFVPDSGLTIRNSTFLNYTGIEGALYWSSGINIANCSFVANSNGIGSGAAIEHAFSGQFTYSNLQFSDNDYDINFSVGTAQDLIIDATNGTNVSTFISGAVGSTITINNSVSLTLTNIVPGSEVRIRASGNPNVTLYSEETVGAGGNSVYTYNYPPIYDDVDIFIHAVSGYKWYSLTTTLPATSQSQVIAQIPDRNYSNP